MPTTRSKKRNHAIAIEPAILDQAATMTSSTSTAKLFSPWVIANGKIKLSHRVVMAPMTRNRGVPLRKGTPEEPNRTWLADDLVAEYYQQRASKGGLLITEGIPPSIEVMTLCLLTCTLLTSDRQVQCPTSLVYFMRRK